MKPIRFTKHAQSYTGRRGFTFTGVEQAIRQSAWEPAELGGMECQKAFPFRSEWSGKTYAIKQVRPVFVEESLKIAVVTVYPFYY